MAGHIVSDYAPSTPTTKEDWLANGGERFREELGTLTKALHFGVRNLLEETGITPDEMMKVSPTLPTVMKEIIRTEYANIVAATKGQSIA